MSVIVNDEVAEGLRINREMGCICPEPGYNAEQRTATGEPILCIQHTTPGCPLIATMFKVPQPAELRESEQRNVEAMIAAGRDLGCVCDPVDVHLRGRSDVTGEPFFAFGHDDGCPALGHTIRIPEP